MKKILIALLLVTLLLVNITGAFAMNASDAKDDWKAAKEASREARETHRNAKVDYAADKTDENLQAVIETGKNTLNAGLDEAQAWLEWKQIEAEANDELPEELVEQIQEDVATNLDKIDELRADVEGIENQLGLGLVFLKMIGKYAELITDVARNAGASVIVIADERIEKVEEFEQKIRDATTDEDVLAKLDEAVEDIEEAKENVQNAEEAYEEIVIGGTPLMKFAEANNYIRTARTNLFAAHTDLRQAFRMIKEAN